MPRSATGPDQATHRSVDCPAKYEVRVVRSNFARRAEALRANLFDTQVPLAVWGEITVVSHCRANEAFEGYDLGGSLDQTQVGTDHLLVEVVKIGSAADFDRIGKAMARCVHDRTAL
jgi:hypothetical protein